MPLGMLRLINPPGHRRRSSRWPRYTRRNSPPARRGGVRTAHYRFDTATGRPLRPTRYYHSSAAYREELERPYPSRKPRRNPKRASRPRHLTGPKKGKFMSNREIAAKRASAKRKRARRNPMIGGKYVNLRAGGHTGTAPKRRKPAAKRKAAAKPKRRKTAKRTGGTTVAKRRRRVRRRASRKNPIRRRRIRRRRVHRNVRRRVRRRRVRRNPVVRRRRRRTVRFNRPVRRRRRRAVRFNVRRRRRRVRRNPRLTRGRSRRMKAPRRWHGRRKLYRIQQWRRGKRYRYTVHTAKRNPLSAMKTMLVHGGLMWAGFKGMKAIAALIRVHVMPKLGTSIPAQLTPILPAAGAFVAAAFAGKFVKKPALLNALQTGAALALYDVLFEQFVKPALPPSVTPYLGGYGEYMPAGSLPYGSRVNLTRAMNPMAGFGEYTREAMARDEYVPAGLLGSYDVSDSLTGGEIASMTTGHASGVFKKTSLG